jgi:WD40 repeat protein
VVALLAGLLVFLVFQYNTATKQRDLADSRGLAAQANARANDKLDLAALLAVQAWNIADTIDARTAALTMVHRAEGIDAELRSPNDGVITAIAVSPTQPLLAVGGHDRAIRLWDLSRRRPRGEPLVLPESKQTGETGVSFLAFSPDGSRIAAIYSGGATVIWTPPLGSIPPPQPRILKPQLDQAIRITFSANGKFVAATGFDGRIAFWNADTGAPVGSLKAAAAGKTSLAFPDPDTLVAFTHPSSADKGTSALTRWNLHKASRISSLPIPLSQAFDSTISPDGRTLVTWGSDGLATWDTSTGQQSAHEDRPEIYPTSDLVIDPRGERLAVITKDQQVELFELPSLRPSAVQPLVTLAVSVTFSADSRTLIIGGAGLTSLWSLEHPQQLSTSLGTTPLRPAAESSSSESSSSEPSTSLRISVAIEADGGRRHDTTVGTSIDDPSRLISVGRGTLRAWRLPEQRPMQEILVDKYLRAVAVSANGNEVAVVNDDNVIQTWHVGDPALSAGTKLEGPIGLARDTSGPSAMFAIQGTDSLALSADGTTLATGGGTNDDRIRLWDTRRGVQWGPELRHGDEGVQVLAFSPRGDLLASGHGQAIVLWRVVPAEDGTKRLEPFNPNRELVGHIGSVNDIAFSPDGTRVLSGGSDDTVRLWDVNTGQAIGQPIVAPAGAEAVAFANDGKTIAAAGNYGLQLWDAATGQSLGDVLTSNTELTDVAFNADGQLLSTIDKSGEVVAWSSLLWSADRGVVSEGLCAAASRNLTRGEWEQFLPERRYELTCPQWPPGE